MVEEPLFTQLVFHRASSDAPCPDAPPGYYWVTSYEDELKLFCRTIPLDFPFELDSSPLPLPANGTLWIPARHHAGYHFVLKRLEDCDRHERAYLDRPYNYTALPRDLRASLRVVTNCFPRFPQSWGRDMSDSTDDPDASMELVFRPSGVNFSLSDFTVVREHSYKLRLTLGGARCITSEEYASVCALHRRGVSRRVFFNEFRALSENLLRSSRSSPLIASLTLTDVHRPAIGMLNLDFVPDPDYRHVGLHIAPECDRWLSYCDVRMCLRTYLGISDALAHSIWCCCRQMYVHDDVSERGQQFIKASLNLVSATHSVDVYFSYDEWLPS